MFYEPTYIENCGQRIANRGIRMRKFHLDDRLHCWSAELDLQEFKDPV